MVFGGERLTVEQAPLACKRSTWYFSHMRTTADKKARRTAMFPITSAEEAPILSEEERAEMLASLTAAEARIAAGQCVEHNPDTFVDRLMDVRASAMRNGNE
ncbi:MAG: hypothetical protein ACLPGW_04110 [Roseiarcus sp.]